MSGLQELEMRAQKLKLELAASEATYHQLLDDIKFLKGNSRKVTTDVAGRPLPCELYLDGFLKSNLDDLHLFVKKDWDNLGFICGYEGDGKSVLAQTAGLYLYGDLSLDQIVFDTEEFFAAVDSAPPGAALIWDEADELGANWQDSILKAVKSKMKRIRDKNLHIILVTPVPFDLNKYFVIHRTRWLLHVYAEGLTRGFFRFFSREAKKRLYLKGRKEWDWAAARPDFSGRFVGLPDGFPIDWAAYKAKKAAATARVAEAGKKVNKAGVRAEYRRERIPFLVRWVSQKFGVEPTQAEIGFVFGVKQQQIHRDMQSDAERWEIHTNTRVDVPDTYEGRRREAGIQERNDD